ncbi:MAG: hypothetical protein H6825_09140 [Planctomycetes bacterium]|nr:hypothetical protein [Planctomycetota bacterium]
MAQPLVQYGLVPILAGVLGAASTAFVLSIESDHATSPGTEAAAIEPLRQQMARIESDAGLLKRRLDDIEQMVWRMPASPGGEGGGEPRPLVDEQMLELQQRVDALTSALNDASVESGGGPFLDTVASALETIRQREDEQREADRKALMEQRLDERLGELATEIGLDTWQQNEMKTLFTDTGARRDEIFAKARESGDFGGMRDAMQAIDAERGSKLASIMTPSQLEKYNEMGGIERGFFGGPGRGGFGGFGGRDRGDRGPGGGPGPGDGQGGQQGGQGN